RRGVGGLTAGHVDPDPFQGSDLLPERDAQRVLVGPGYLALLAMKGRDALRRGLESHTFGFRQRSQSRIHLRLRDRQSLWCQAYAIERPRIGEERAVALLFDCPQNSADPLFHL